MQNTIIRAISDSLLLKQQVLQNDEILQNTGAAAQMMINAFRHNGKVLFCGNGGSAADAQHLAAELSGRYYYDRPPLQAEALHVNTSFVTAVANDYGYDYVFARMVEAWGSAGDVLVALSTSGNSPSIIKAIEAARYRQMSVIGFTGQTGGQMATICDLLIKIPGSDTPRIQETHILLGHIICELVEKELFPRKS